ncbi:hypothetical protein M758_10G175700 [Ceratodon purpureus]|nr:hypothetical protein M758_10G175700 [Ceratodon purpureus]
MRVTTMTDLRFEEAIVVIDSVKVKAKCAQISAHQCQTLANRFQHVGLLIKQRMESDVTNGSAHDEISSASILTALKKGEMLVTECMSADSKVLVSLVRQEDFEEIHKELSLCITVLSLLPEGAEHAAKRDKLVDVKEVNQATLLADARLDEAELLKKLTTNSFYTMDETLGSSLMFTVSEMLEVNHFEYSLVDEDEEQLPSYVQIEPADLKDEKFQGVGDYGKVTNANWIGCTVVIKDFPWCGGYTDSWYEEALPMIRYRHPHVMQLMGFCPGTKKVVTEYMLGGDLRKFIDMRLQKSGRQRLQDGPFSLTEAMDIMRQIAQGLYYMHQNKYMHGDRVLTLNVMVKESLNGHPPYVKIGDFGVSQDRRVEWRLDLDKPYPEDPRKESVRWTAPEVYSCIQGKEIMHYSAMSDIYGFGILCSEILTGNLPFRDITNSTEVRSRVLSGERPQLPDTLDPDLEKLIRDCWEGDCTLRPTANQICERLEQIMFPIQNTTSIVTNLNIDADTDTKTKSSTDSDQTSETVTQNSCGDQTSEVTQNSCGDQTFENGQQEIAKSKNLERQLSLPYYLQIPKSDLEIISLLGKGGFAKVYEAKWQGSKCAVKEFKGAANILELQKEVQILMTLRHPNIVELLGFSADPCAIVMELMTCHLPKLYKRRMRRSGHQGHPFTYAIILKIITQIASGMAHLHNSNILHRDLKGANVLVHDHGNDIEVKIADFGVSQHTCGVSDNYYTGTGFWRSPELLCAKKERRPFDYTTKGDVYSFAMTCYEVITGKSPFEDSIEEYGHGEVEEMLVNPAGNSAIPRRPKLPEANGVSLDLLHLIEECWNDKPDARPSFLEIADRLQRMPQQ